MGKLKLQSFSDLIESLASFPEKINSAIVHKRKHNNHQQQQQLVEACQSKENETQKQKKTQDELELLFKRRVDPIHVLPIEIIDLIFLLLSQEVLIICIQVSKSWRAQILLACADVWRNIIIQDNKQDKQLACVISYIGVHVKHMIINTTSEKVRFKCLKNIKNGHFNRIQSLKITMLGLQDMEHYIAPITTSLRKIENTLTSFTIDVGNTKNPVLIAEILASCSNLSNLIYSTTTSLSTQQTGNENSDSHSKKLNQQHYSLQNLQIRAPSITGSDIDSILKYCLALRRLVMNECDPSVLNTIVGHATPNLEILGYERSDDSFPVPPLPAKKNQHQKETISHNHRRRSQQHHHNKKTKKQKMVGNLRILHIANNSNKPIPARNIIPLLYKNRKSLNYIMACISSITETELEQFHAKYPDFQLHNVTRLVFWPYKGIQEFLLHAVYNSTKLSFLHAVNAQDINVVITALLEMPPLKRLSIKNPKCSSTRTTEVQSAPSELYLNILFKKYARLSLSSPKATTASSSSRSFKSLVLRGCNCVTDRELATLSNIKTLKRITFQELINVSTHGLMTLFIHLNNQLTSIRLAEMRSVTDDILSLFGDMDNLTCIKLENLQQVTDQGIKILVNKKKANKSSPRLIEFSLYNCPSITSGCMFYVKQNIPIAAIISAH
ncbi:hypothetical protein BDC45DRAFT_504788 [Circinella umbellata]|nr:hypothetical protein BDC45DRAFT_504788 [Circinella umbellata]